MKIKIKDILKIVYEKNEIIVHLLEKNKGIVINGDVELINSFDNKICAIDNAKIKYQ